MADLHLSPRELQVLGLAASGMTNRQVAAQLQLTVHAVKFHLAGTYRKLGVGNRTAAAVAYHRTLANGATGLDPVQS
jgi:DNA-binding CsgD family transcriptional regulator